MALGVQKLNAGDGLELRDFNRFADFKLGDVDIDNLRQILRQTTHPQQMGVHLKHAVLVFDTKRFTRGHDGDANFEQLVGLHFLKVEVEIFVGDRVTLNLLKERKRFFGFSSLVKLNQDGATRNYF